MDVPILFAEDKSDTFRCQLCPHNCLISENKFGVCKVRTVKAGKPVAINYGEVTSLAVDPIEKKPLYHFKPSKDILSIGSFGCNMTCSFCQNHEISQSRPPSDFISVQKLIEIIPTIENNVGVAFTYNEPMMWYEYMYDAAKAIKAHNKNTSIVVVTNGYINEQPLMALLPYVDAMNIDLKGYTNKYYTSVCGAKLSPVLETIKRCNDYCHVELTTLLVTDENDTLGEVGQIAEFISGVNDNIPLHLSRYFPRYKMKNQPTQINTLKVAQNEAKKYLKYVYIGNVSGVDNNTYCPNCNALIVQRDGYSIRANITQGKCNVCGEKLNMII